MAPDEQAIQQYLDTRARSPVTVGLRAKRLVWSVVQATLYGCSFHTASRWRAMLLRAFGARIGAACTIRRTSRVYYPWNLTMGDMSCLGDQCVVYNLGAIEIGQRVVVSQEAYLCAGSHDYRYLSMPLVTPPIVLKDDAWVCARAFIGPGVTVGEGSIVGAAAVAMSDVPDWTIVGGNPAKFIKPRPRPIQS